MTSPTSDNEIDEIIRKYVNNPVFEPVAKAALIDLRNRYAEKQVKTAKQMARQKAASDIFNLAHKYAQEDKTMIGAESLRGYHYFNAIHKIGKFDGR